MKNSWFMIQVFVLMVAVTLAYMNSLSGPFIFDDQGSVVDNRYIQKLSPLTDVLFKAIPDSPPAGRPIVSLSFAINYAVGRLVVRGYHLFNIAVHMLATFVLCGVLRRTLIHTRLHMRFGRAGPFVAFAIALIWAVHPLLTESVTYISQRTELLMGLFYLLTLYCAIRAWQLKHTRIWSVLAVLSCAAGMGCKEAMVSAPLMVLFYDVTLISPSWRDALRKHLPLYIGLAATWGLLAWLNISGPRSQTCGAGLGMNALDYLRTQAAIIVWYLRLCFWPHPLVISYEDWPLAKSFLAIWPQGLFIVTLLALTAYGLWRRHPIALLGAWFFMILAPTSSFIPIITEIAAERRMYLPSVAVVAAAIVSAYEVAHRLNRRSAESLRATMIIATILLTITAVALGITTHIRNRDYASAITIWADALTKRPDNPQAMCNLATAFVNIGEYEQVSDLCTRAIELRPDQSTIYSTRGMAYAASGQYSQAIQDFDRAIELHPDYASTYNKRGSAYGNMGDAERAIADYTKAVELQPNFVEAYRNRGIAYARMRDYTRAIDDFTFAIQLQPNSAELYYNRGVAYGIVKDYENAIRDYTEASKLRPDHANTYNNRGNVYQSLGDYARAIEDLSEAIALQPDHAPTYNNRARAYYSTGQYDKALADITQCQKLGGRVKPAFIKSVNKALKQSG